MKSDDDQTIYPAAASEAGDHLTYSGRKNRLAMFRQLKPIFILSFALFVGVLTTSAAQAPPLTFHAADGGSVNLADSRGKVVVLSFGGTWMPLAAKELPA